MLTPICTTVGVFASITVASLCREYCELTGAEFGSVSLLLFVVIGAAHVCGWLFAKLRQPRVAGEIFAGVLLGSAVLGRLAPRLSQNLFAADSAQTHSPQDVVLGFLYNLGLLLLMFVSGAETKGLFKREETREIAWLGGVGTLVPFALALAAAPLLPLGSLAGAASSSRLPLVLVIAIAVAVTSIPVISRILYDLNVLHTRFARLVLGVAVVEDIALWAVLAVATALAKSGGVQQTTIAVHIAATLFYFVFGLAVAPVLLKKISRSRFNVVVQHAPIAYVFLVLMAYSAIAASMDVSMVFAAFLAGHAVVRDKRLIETVQTVGRVSFAVFIPIYFVVVGYRLNLTSGFSFALLGASLSIACAVKLLAASAGARLAGFAWRDSANLAMALNARGGPGIVLASVAFDAGIISAAFYTALVLVAVLTSQMAGAWLEHVRRTDGALLSKETAERDASRETIARAA
jgi:Kef-type K+ transport system membrane component KefB